MLDKTMIFSINGDRDQEIKNAMISVYNSLTLLHSNCIRIS